MICLGGDGTLIQAARDLAGRKIPLFGINMGHLGYLTQIGHEEDILPAMRDLMEDHYRLESRMMLKGCVISGGKVIMEDIALNDIVLNRIRRMAWWLRPRPVRRHTTCQRAVRSWRRRRI